MKKLQTPKNLYYLRKSGRYFFSFVTFYYSLFVDSLLLHHYYLFITCCFIQNCVLLVANSVSASYLLENCSLIAGVWLVTLYHSLKKFYVAAYKVNRYLSEVIAKSLLATCYYPTSHAQAFQLPTDWAAPWSC